MRVNTRFLVGRLELPQMEKVTSNGVGSAGATGKPWVWLWLQLSGFQNWETKLPEVSDMGFL